VHPLNAKFWPGRHLAGLEFYLFAGPGAEGANDDAPGQGAILDGVTAPRASPGKIPFVTIFEGESVI